MQQRNKFWIALALITVVCFLDYQLFTEGYAVRSISPAIRQAGHFAILLAVIPIGWWAWKAHPIRWFRMLWAASYGFAIGFILSIGALKALINTLPEAFLDWASTVRYFFTSPLPHLLLYMLALIAKQQGGTEKT